MGLFPKWSRADSSTRFWCCFRRACSRYWQMSILMPSHHLLFVLRATDFFLISFAAVATLRAQAAKQAVPQTPVPDADHVDAVHTRERNE